MTKKLKVNPKNKNRYVTTVKFHKGSLRILIQEIKIKK